MDITVVQAFITPQMGIILAALWVVEYICKKLEFIPDKYIVFIVAVFGIAGAFMFSGVSFQSGLQGFLCAAVAVYGNQIKRQVQKKE
jgi:hypothetical protein